MAKGDGGWGMGDKGWRMRFGGVWEWRGWVGAGMVVFMHE